MKKKFYLTVLFILLFSSCLTPKSEPAIVEIVVPKIDEPVIVQDNNPEPIVVPEETEPEEFVVTEEEYDKTFDQIETFISDLNKIISSGKFIEWQKYLSDSYINKYGDADFLKNLSDNPVLKEYGIKLKQLRDYFNYVVVPSRSNVVIDEIQFVDENIIKALTFTNNEKFVVYLLIRTETGWIITD